MITTTEWKSDDNLFYCYLGWQQQKAFQPRFMLTFQPFFLLRVIPLSDGRWTWIIRTGGVNHVIVLDGQYNRGLTYPTCDLAKQEVLKEAHLLLKEAFIEDK